MSRKKLQPAPSDSHLRFRCVKSTGLRPGPFVLFARSLTENRVKCMADTAFTGLEHIVYQVYPAIGTGYLDSCTYALTGLESLNVGTRVSLNEEVKLDCH